MTTTAAGSTTVNVEAIPTDLRTHKQWVVWRYGPPRKDGKPEKQPYTPQTSKLAKPNDSATWGTFDDALAQYETGNYKGIGFVVHAGDPYVGVDLDGCRDAETGELRTWARRIIERLNTYTEVSPSGRGVRLWLHGVKPGTSCKRTLSKTEQIEVYDHDRFFTVTGHHLTGTPSTIEDRQTGLDSWYAEVFPPAPTSDSPVHPDEPSEPVDVDDAVLLERASCGKNGARFQRLWAGDTSDYHDDANKADLALCGTLAFYTGSDANRMDRLFRQSGLYREKWERSDYRERTIQKAIANTSSTYRPTSRGSSHGHVQRILHVYDWQHLNETPYQRNRLLAQVAEDAKEQVRAHFEAQSTTPLVLALPPGVGKSHAIADLGRTVDVAWISERHDMRESVAGLKSYYRPIIGCSADNCPDFRRHEALVAKGRNTWPLHKSHMCDYFGQHAEEGSAVYQIAHVQTAYPKKHKAIVTDELNLSSYLPVRSISYNTMQAVLASPETEPWAERLVRALREVVTRAQRESEALHGKAVFDALNTELGGGSQLQTLVRRQTLDPLALQTRPTASVDLSIEEIDALPPVVMPYILRALVAELPKWEQGGEWNSCIQVSPGPHGWELQIIEPRQFPLEEGETLPPWAILDATADAGFLEQLLGMSVQLVREEVTPPPHMRHVAVRTGKRYGKVSLVNAKHRDDEQRRVVQELRFLLREIDPNGIQQQAGEVGLITFQGAEGPLGDALGIPGNRRGHFWAMRGSNALANCTILLIVGTPTPNLTVVETWARALYRDDPDSITTERERDELGHEQYTDARLRVLVDYLINAELTQCAHRNRLLRHDARTVVTLCQGDVGYVPVTETITAFPRLTDDGGLYAEEKSAKDEEKLEVAAQKLEEEEISLTVRRLARLARVADSTASDWLRKRRDTAPHPRVADSAE